MLMKGEYNSLFILFSENKRKKPEERLKMRVFRNVKCSSNNFSISPNDIIDEAMVLYK